MPYPLEMLQIGISNCERCALSKTRTKAVPGQGGSYSEVMFIGEAPGFREDLTGSPFTGPAGDVLRRLIKTTGLERDQYYLANSINCRPPNNRDPSFKELETCKIWLDQQIAILPDLRIIVALGRFASLYLCPDYKPSDVRGSARLAPDGKIHMFFLHPAAVLHNPDSLPELEGQFELLKTLL